MRLCTTSFAACHKFLKLASSPQGGADQHLQPQPGAAGAKRASSETNKSAVSNRRDGVDHHAAERGGTKGANNDTAPPARSTTHVFDGGEVLFNSVPARFNKSWAPLGAPAAVKFHTVPARLVSRVVMKTKPATVSKTLRKATQDSMVNLRDETNLTDFGMVRVRLSTR